MVSWNEYVWQSLLLVIEEFELADKMALKARQPFPFKAYGLAYCPSCDNVIDAQTDAFVNTVFEYEPIFPYVVTESMRRASWCRLCSQPAIPVGYAVSQFGRMLPLRYLEDEEELERYVRAFGTLKNHPEAQEVYTIGLVTAFNRSLARFYRIFEGDGGGKFQLIKIVKNPKIWWNMKLEKLDLDKILTSKRH
jgi:hypothetical protein